MFCPFCQAQDTKVIDSRLVGDGSQIRRRRECEVCRARFTTFETADLALPRINAMSFWLQPVGALLIFTGIFSGAAADTGWTGYAPYIVSETAHSGTTMWVAGQIMLVASSTLTGINFLTTICAMRAPTMGWMQMPLLEIRFKNY